jgi:hypothetical protein
LRWNPFSFIFPVSQAESKGEKLKDITFGLILAGVGFGTTFLVLLIISLLCDALRKIFPYREEDRSV